MKKTTSYNIIAIAFLCLITNIVFSQNKTAVTFDMAAANKAIQLQIRAFETRLKKGDPIALGDLYTTDAKFMNHGSPSTVGRDNIISAFGEMIRDSITGSGFTTIGLWGRLFFPFKWKSNKPWQISFGMEKRRWPMENIPGYFFFRWENEAIKNFNH